MRLLFFALLISNLCSGQGFTVNVGQFDHLQIETDQDIAFHTKVNGMDYFFSPERVHLIGHKWEDANHTARSSERIVLEFRNANTQNINGRGKRASIKNFLRSDITCQTNDFDTVYYKNLWPQIDAQFYVWNGKLKWDYIVHPGGKVEDIRWSYKGAQTSIEKQAVYVVSNLIVLKSNYPKVYQNGRANVAFDLYMLDGSLGINVDDYDVNKDLIIDPWANYLGGTDVDENYGIDVDSLGNVYTSGYTISTDFPVTPGVMSTTSDLDYDSYVTKFDSTGLLVWSTYYAGSGGDYGRNVKVDAEGNTYLFGNTTSSDLLVSSSGVFQSVNNGLYNSFILKLNPSGQFIWATYFGGTNGDLALAGDLWKDRLAIGGFTSSMNMPVISGFQNTHGGSTDGFIAVFDTTGNIQWSTFYGGSNSEDVHAITFDEDGNVVATGDSYSNNLPTSSGAFQTTNNGGKDCYMVKFDPNGQRLFGTYFGGIGNDDAFTVKSKNGRIYVAGYTTSNDFPISVGCFKDTLSSNRDGYFARFTSSGVLDYASYFGGSGNDEFTAMDVSDDRIVLLMNTMSDSLQIYGIPKQSYKGLFSDTYVVMFDTSWNPGFSTYYGGESAEYGYGIKLFDDHTIHWSFHTGSTNLSFGANQNFLTSNTDAMVIKLDAITGYFVKTPMLNQESVLVTYPNPSSGIITIDNWLEFDQFKVLDVQGKLVYTSELKGSSLDLTFLSNGMYYLTLMNSRKNVASARIVIQK